MCSIYQFGWVLRAPQTFRRQILSASQAADAVLEMSMILFLGSVSGYTTYQYSLTQYAESLSWYHSEQ